MNTDFTYLANSEKVAVLPMQVGRDGTDMSLLENGTCQMGNFAEPASHRFFCEEYKVFSFCFVLRSGPLSSKSLADVLGSSILIPAAGL